MCWLVVRPSQHGEGAILGAHSLPMPLYALLSMGVRQHPAHPWFLRHCSALFFLTKLKHQRSAQHSYIRLVINHMIWSHTATPIPSFLACVPVSHMVFAHAQYVERTFPKVTKFEKCTSDKKKNRFPFTLLHHWTRPWFITGFCKVILLECVSAYCALQVSCPVERANRQWLSST